MTYAIVTKKLSGSDTKGARMRATYNKKTKNTPYDHASNLDGNHRAAAYALAKELFNLKDFSLTHGILPDGNYVWLFDDVGFSHDEHVQNIQFAQRSLNRWVQHIGIGFHPDTRGADYEPPLTAGEAKQYDLDMLFCQLVLQDPYAAGLRAMKDAGLLDAA